MRSIHRMAALALLAGFAACQDTIPTQVSDVSNDGVVEFDGATYSFRVVNRVSMGSPDFCNDNPACDANFSLSARSHSDGSVRGQWQDTFGQGVGGGYIHVEVDCLRVVGNGAVLGGVIAHGNDGGTDLTGFRAITAVVDNGTSKNDTPDQLSFSFFPDGRDCTTLVPSDLPLFDLIKGQVTVR